MSRQLLLLSLSLFDGLICCACCCVLVLVGACCMILVLCAAAPVLPFFVLACDGECGAEKAVVHRLRCRCVSAFAVACFPAWSYRGGRPISWITDYSCNVKKLSNAKDHEIEDHRESVKDSCYNVKDNLAQGRI